MDQASGLRKMVDSRSGNLKRQAASMKQSKTETIHSPRVIAVTSGKGGVGKTNVVGNLAIAMAKMGKKVLILDADLGLANIDIIFGIHPKFNIGHVIEGEKQLLDVIAEGPHGIKIIPAGSGFTGYTHLTEGQKLNLLSEFESLDQEIDVFLIDTGAGISSNVLYFNLAADECIIIATPEPTSNTDAYAMMKVMSTQHGARHFKLIVNMVFDENEAKLVYANLSNAADRFLQGIVLEYVGYVPNDDHLKTAVKSRKTVINMYPNAKSSKKLNHIAKVILNAPRRNETDGNIKFFLNRFMSLQTG